jgi:hypothetical protein
MPTSFLGTKAEYGAEPMPRETWRQKLITLPVVFILLPILGLCCLILLLPVFVIERWISKS